jgi:hypothetical protein
MAMINIFLARQTNEKRNANINRLCIQYILFRILKHGLYHKASLNTPPIPYPIMNKGREERKKRREKGLLR